MNFSFILNSKFLAMPISDAQKERNKIAAQLIMEAENYFTHLMDGRGTDLQTKKAAKQIVLDMLDQKIQTLTTFKKHFPKSFPTMDAITKIANEQTRRLRMLKATIITNF
jgi:hypothetical protein